jgi:hypothetical protein
MLSSWESSRIQMLPANVRLIWKGTYKRSSLIVSVTKKKSFIRLTPGVMVIKLFSPSLIKRPNKLERLSLASLFNLVYYLRYAQEPNLGGGGGEPECGATTLSIVGLIVTLSINHTQNNVVLSIVFYGMLGVAAPFLVFCSKVGFGFHLQIVDQGPRVIKLFYGCKLQNFLIS